MGIGLSILPRDSTDPWGAPSSPIHVANFFIVTFTGSVNPMSHYDEIIQRNELCLMSESNLSAVIIANAQPGKHPHLINMYVPDNDQRE